MFPIPKYDLTPQRDLAAETSLPTKTMLMQANMSIDIRPPRSPVLEGEPGDDVIVIPLGTSSAVPSKYRNVSSTVLQIPGWGNIMLDCGEGTWGQLVRSFGDDFSHHHMGLTKLLTMRQLMNPPPTEPLPQQP
ncbi:hypothetical protein A0H81_02334 [Grifola frondosa]|uniref:ribonuclease Z n=1 Tax=Grifola frondosa TaxID=5627 RepID=A0A1C7ML59_GRIFR|nr:hypothetical protein A0H81_02334 [Grifola frondosa]